MMSASGIMFVWHGDQSRCFRSQPDRRKLLKSDPCTSAPATEIFLFLNEICFKIPVLSLSWGRFDARLGLATMAAVAAATMSISRLEIVGLRSTMLLNLMDCHGSLIQKMYSTEKNIFKTGTENE
jgi:hypothetical protein